VEEDVIEKPDISDERIISALREKCSISSATVNFLPLGLDAASWAYRVDTPDGAYFLKLRRKPPNRSGVLISRYLKERGIHQVVAPIPLPTGEAWAEADGFFFILYPFVDGQQVMDVSMSDDHWVEFGYVLKQIHSTKLPSDILGQIRRETFVPEWLDWDKRMHARVSPRQCDDPFQQELAQFWAEKYSTISTILQRMEMLMEQMQASAAEFVLCHGDIHTANLLITNDDKIFIVDWEEAKLAPKERDLMFLPGDVGTRENQLFYEGYGPTQIDALASVYYRYHWCVEDMGAFAALVFTQENVGEKTKADSIAWFKSLFAPGSSVETALSTALPV